MKQRDVVERETRLLDARAARNDDLARKASIRSQRSQATRASSLRRSGSRRSLKQRFRESLNSWFDEEDYITDQEGETGTRLRRNPSQRSVTFAEPPRQSFDSIQSEPEHLFQPPPQQSMAPAPVAGDQQIVQTPPQEPSGPPPQPTYSPPAQPQNVPPPAPQYISPPTASTLVPSASVGPSVAHPQPYDPSYQGPPVFANNPPPVPFIGQGPDGQRSTYQPLPSGPPGTNPQPQPSQLQVGYPPQGYSQMQTSPLEEARRRAAQSQANLDAVNERAANLERQWLEEDQLNRQIDKNERLARKRAEDLQRRESDRSGRAPPREQETQRPKKSKNKFSPF